MTTVATHAANIVGFATDADALIAQLIPVLASIAAEEDALYRENGTSIGDHIAGRRRLTQYAIERLSNSLLPAPSTPRRTVAELATAAWSVYL